MPDAFDVDEVVAQLTLEEKAALTIGSGFWYTAAVERLGVGLDPGLRRTARAAGPTRRTECRLRFGRGRPRRHRRQRAGHLLP